MGCSGLLWKKATRAMRAMRENVPFQPYLACTESFLKVLSDKHQVLPSNETREQNKLSPSLASLSEPKSGIAIC